MAPGVPEHVVVWDQQRIYESNDAANSWQTVEPPDSQIGPVQILTDASLVGTDQRAADRAHVVWRRQINTQRWDSYVLPSFAVGSLASAGSAYFLFTEHRLYRLDWTGAGSWQEVFLPQ